MILVKAKRVHGILACPGSGLAGRFHDLEKSTNWLQVNVRGTDRTALFATRESMSAPTPLLSVGIAGDEVKKEPMENLPS